MLPFPNEDPEAVQLYIHEMEMTPQSLMVVHGCHHDAPCQLQAVLYSPILYIRELHATASLVTAKITSKFSMTCMLGRYGQQLQAPWETRCGCVPAGRFMQLFREQVPQVEHDLILKYGVIMIIKAARMATIEL